MSGRRVRPNGQSALRRRQAASRPAQTGPAAGQLAGSLTCPSGCRPERPGRGRWLRGCPAAKPYLTTGRGLAHRCAQRRATARQIGEGLWARFDPLRSLRGVGFCRPFPGRRFLRWAVRVSVARGSLRSACVPEIRLAQGVLCAAKPRQKSPNEFPRPARRKRRRRRGRNFKNLKNFLVPPGHHFRPIL